MRFFEETLGREIEVPDRPERIVSLAPSITDTLFRLGLDDRVVGISLYCNRPKDRLEGIPRVGAYLNVIWDRLEELQPDLVLTTTGAQRRITEELMARGFPVAPVPVPVSIFGVLDGVRKVGLLTGAEREAERLNLSLLGTLNSLKGSLPSLRTYYEIDLGGPITVGAASYITDALHLLGLENVYASQRRPYVQPDDALTVSLKPELIIYEVKPGRRYTPSDVEARLRDRFGDVGIVVLPSDSLAHYGPSLVDEVLPDAARRVSAVL
ncbi:MAG: ABC transporter substrate-binding protein [Thermotogae bacterium]|nr:ABC transporter substrate-binding protein [Thermotogota bacterium]